MASMMPNFAAPYQGKFQGGEAEHRVETHPLLSVSLTDRLANGLFVLLLEAFLSTVVFLSAGISYCSDVIVIINSEIIQDVTVVSCLPLPL
jgi:hypothetical protein